MAGACSAELAEDGVSSVRPAETSWAPNGINKNRASAPPNTPVRTSNAGVSAGPAHSVAAANNLTSPPPRNPRAKSTAPTRKTAPERSKSAGEARSRREIHRPQHAEHNRQQVRNDQAPEILKGRRRHYDGERGQRDGVELHDHREKAPLCAPLAAESPRRLTATARYRAQDRSGMAGSGLICPPSCRRVVNEGITTTRHQSRSTIALAIAYAAMISGRGCLTSGRAASAQPYFLWV